MKPTKCSNKLLNNCWTNCCKVEKSEGEGWGDGKKTPNRQKFALVWPKTFTFRCCATLKGGSMSIVSCWGGAVVSTRHSLRYTLHWTNNVYSILYTFHLTLCTLYTLVSISYTLHHTLYTVQSTLYCTLHSPLSSLLCISHSSFSTPCSLQINFHSPLFILYSPLYNIHFTPYTVHSARCTLYTLDSTYIYHTHCTMHSTF